MATEFESENYNETDAQKERPLYQLEKISLADFDSIKSNIPTELLSRLTKEEQYLFGTMSQIKEQNRWLAANQVRQNQVLRSLIRKQHAQETWRIVFSTKWGLIAWAGGLTISVILVELIKAAAKKFFAAEH